MRLFSRTFRVLHRGLFYESQNGRAAEIAAWSNALAALGLGAASYFVLTSWVAAVVVAPLAFMGLRLSLVNRKTLWIAAVLGTLAVAGTAGGLGWLFGHLAEARAVPPIMCALAAIGAGLVPAWAFSKLASVREVTRDSLIDASSVPSSRL